MTDVRPRKIMRWAEVALVVGVMLGCNDAEDRIAPEPVESANLAQLSCEELAGLAPSGSDYDTAFTRKGTTLAVSWPPSDNRTGKRRKGLRFGGVEGGGIEYFSSFGGEDLSNPGATRIPLDFGLIRMEDRALCFGAGSIARPTPDASLEIRSPMVTLLGEGTPVEDAERQLCESREDCATAGGTISEIDRAGADDEVVLMNTAIGRILLGPDSAKPRDASEVEIHATLVQAPNVGIVQSVYDVSGTASLKQGRYVVKLNGRKRLLGSCDPIAGTEAVLACRD